MDSSSPQHFTERPYIKGYYYSPMTDQYYPVFKNIMHDKKRDDTTEGVLANPYGISINVMEKEI